MDSPSILPASLEDAAAILELQHEAYQSEARLYDDWSIPPLTQTLAQLQAELQESVVLKVVAGGLLLGSIRARAEEGVVQVGRLIVAPAAQRQGIGSALLTAIESAFPATRRFELFTGSRSEGNLRLYRRHGYIPTHEKVLSPSVKLVFMSKLNGTAD